MFTGRISAIKNKINILSSYACTIQEWGKRPFENQKEKERLTQYHKDIKIWLKENGYGMPKQKYIKVIKSDKDEYKLKAVHQDGSVKYYKSDAELRDEYIYCFGRTYNNKYVVYVKELECLFIWVEQCCFSKDLDDNYKFKITKSDELRIVSNEDTLKSFTLTEDGIFTIIPSYYEYFNNLGWAVAKKHGLYSPIVWLNNSRFAHIVAIETPQSYQRWRDDRSEVNAPKTEPLSNNKWLCGYDLGTLDNPYDYSHMSTKIHDALSGTVVLEKLDENLLVFRLICCNYGDINEMMRIYVSDKEIMTYRVNDAGVFEKYNLFENDDACRHFLLAYFNEELLNGTLLECCKPFIGEITSKNLLYVLVSALKNNHIEQLCKIGFAKSLDEMLYYSATIEQVESELNVDKSRNGIYQWLGVNKYQLNQLLNLVKARDTLRLLADLKKWITVDKKCKTISNIDNDTFDKYLNMMIDLNNNPNQIYPTISFEKINDIKTYVSSYIEMREQDGVKLDENVFKNKTMQYIPKLYEMSKTNRNVVRLYVDYVSAIIRCPIANWKLFPESFDEIKRMHDTAADILEINETKELTAGLDKNIQKVKDLAYKTKEDEFIVKIPTKIEDFINEGNELKHCVKSYIYHVAEGKTNVVMIRRKDEPEKPFFTVEVDNNNIIQQVHGFGNCNADKVPGLMNFVTKWACEKKLLMQNINKMR